MENNKFPNKISTLAKIALLVVAILWGSSLTVVKQASEIFNPNLILALRFTIASLVLIIIFLRKVIASDKKDWRNGLIIGAFMFAAYSVQTIGVTYTAPGRSAFLSSSYCIIVPFLAWAALRKRPDKFNVIAAIFAVIGIYIVSLSDNHTLAPGQENTQLLGDSLAVLSGFLFAAHIISIAKLAKDGDIIILTLAQFVSSACLAWIVTFLFENNQSIQVTSRSVIEILYLAILCTAVALLLQNFGQKFTNESSAAIILSLESVFGILIPVVLGIEHLTTNSVIGFILIFIAIIISETKLSFLSKKAT